MRRCTKGRDVWPGTWGTRRSSVTVGDVPVGVRCWGHDLQPWAMRRRAWTQTMDRSWHGPHAARPTVASPRGADDTHVPTDLGQLVRPHVSWPPVMSPRSPAARHVPTQPGRPYVPRPTSHVPQGLRGFTIVELVMVIVIIGILSVIAHSRFTTYYDLKLEGAARKLAADIRYAQQFSLSQHVTHGIEFDVTNNRYRIYVVSTGVNVTDPLTREAGVSGQNWTSGYVVTYNTDPEFEGIDLTSASFGGTATLRFTSLGKPQDSTGADLAATGSAGMSLQGYSRTVQVTPNTGQVAVQ